MKNRLYDFTAANAAITLTAYLFILILCGYNAFESDHKLAFGIAGAVALVTLILITVKFVFCSAKLGDGGISQGKCAVGKENISVTGEYDARFRESVLLIFDKSLDYKRMEPKERVKRSLKVQATKRNCRILSEYLGREIVAAQKPRRAKRK